MTSPLAVVIMAAGKGTRMKSDLAKVLHPLGGKPMLEYVVRVSEKLSPEKIVVIVGHQAASVQEAMKNFNIAFALQEPQLGTGHAVMQTETALKNFDGDVIVLSGDAPLITAETLDRLLNFHRTKSAAATMLTATLSDPTGYGRVIRDATGDHVVRIAEQKDASESEKQVLEVNSGIYVFQKALLFAALKHIRNDNMQQEFYLPDVFKIFVAEGKTVAAMPVENINEIKGINTPEQLAEAEAALQTRI